MNKQPFLKLPPSLIRSQHVQKKEQIFGYFLGPSLVMTAYSALSGSYLTQFYTDVLGLAGALLTWMPLFSKLLCALTGLCIGRLVDCTRTVQGKARPWILLSGALLSICGLLLYAVPSTSYELKLVWVIVSYNLFFDLAYMIYSLSHSLMIPLSTRDAGARDNLAMLTSIAVSMIPGTLVTIFMPFLIERCGVGAGAQPRWLFLMGALSVLAIPGALMEYFFTLERVTGEAGQDASTNQPSSTAAAASIKAQFLACARNPRWVMIFLFSTVLAFSNGITSASTLYYCNWVLGDSVASGVTNQLLVNVIGQAPMGFGVILLWPLVKKFGKRAVTMAGFSLAAAGCLFILCNPGNMPLILVGLFIKSIGCLPSYVMASFLAEALDCVEKKSGFRTDGFSVSVNNISQMVVGGLAQTLLLAGINGLGYIVPDSTVQAIAQPEALRTFFNWCFVGIPMVCLAVSAGIMVFYRAENA